MQKYAFRMQLTPGMEDEYRRRHDAIWPDLVTLLQGAGISDYSIHLDRETGVPVFGAFGFGQPGKVGHQCAIRMRKLERHDCPNTK